MDRKNKNSVNEIYVGGVIGDNSHIDNDLRNSLLNHLFHSNIIGIFIVKTDGVFIDANDSLLSLIGYTRKELQEGKITRDSVTAPEYDYLSDYAKRTLKKGGETGTYEKEYIHKDGKRIPVLIAVSKIAGTNDLGIGFVLDITRRKQTEERMKEKEEQFRRLVDANVIGVVINSLDGPIYEANDIFLKMVGFSRKELQEGKVNWLSMTPPEYYSLHKKTVKEVLTKGAATPFEKEYVRKDGTRVPVLIGDVLLDKESKKTITFILDITKQKELDQRKDEFIALASHELKTPLTSLKMYAQIVHKELKEHHNLTSARLLNNMDKQIDKLTNLVDDLLDVSRIQSGKLIYKKHAIAVDDFVKASIEELQRVSEKHTLLITGSTNEKVKVDIDRIKQVLTNLVTNAIKYSPKSNKVSITLKKTEDSVQIGVRDYGMGIPIDQQQKIFDRFFQVKRPMSHTYSGLGLGLYISKEIVDRHNGRLWVESHKGHGTTFFFTLPTIKRHQNDKKRTKTLDKS